MLSPRPPNSASSTTSRCAWLWYSSSFLLRAAPDRPESRHSLIFLLSLSVYSLFWCVASCCSCLQSHALRPHPASPPAACTTTSSKPHIRARPTAAALISSPSPPTAPCPGDRPRRRSHQYAQHVLASPREQRQPREHPLPGAPRPQYHLQCCRRRQSSIPQETALQWLVILSCRRCRPPIYDHYPRACRQCSDKAYG